MRSVSPFPLAQRILKFAALALVFFIPSGVFTQSNPFDASPGANTYFGGFGAFNWVSSWSGFVPTAGTQLFASANGNPFPYPNIGMTKVLGGSMANQTYSVSLNMGYYYASPIIFTHFTQLYIGSGNGTMNWVATPSPSVMNVWYTWVGNFTPAAIDIGQPFNFHMNMTLAAMHSFVMDFNINFAVLMKLGLFQVRLDGEDAVLQWETLAANGQSTYSIERSEDGKMFVPIGESSGEGLAFSYVDEDVTHVDATVMYYRLVRTAANGEVHRSDVVQLDLSGQSGIILQARYDRSADELHVECHRLGAETEISVLSIQGETVWKTHVKGADFEGRIPCADLRAGIYFAVVRSAGQSRTIKVLITK